MLRGDDDGVHTYGLTVLVANGDLSLAVGTQVLQGAIVADLSQALSQAARQIMRHRHQGRGLVRSIAEHHALVARADQIDRVGSGTALGLKRFVHALRDIGALFVDEAHDTAGFAVKTVLCAVIADAADGVTRDLLHVNIGLRANLAGNDHGARGHERLACAADVVDVSGYAVGGHVALGLQCGLFGKDGIEDGVGHLVCDLVGMSLGHRFRCEHEVAAIGGGTIGSWHGMPLSITRPTTVTIPSGICVGRHSTLLPI